MTLGISQWVDPDAIKRLREQAQIDEKAAAKAAARQPLPRKRETCRACAGRRIRLTPEHKVERCPACGGTATTEMGA